MIDIQQYHWFWYLTGMIGFPYLTVMIALDIYSNMPIVAKVIFTMWAFLLDCKITIKTK